VRVEPFGLVPPDAGRTNRLEPKIGIVDCTRQIIRCPNSAAFLARTAKMSNKACAATGSAAVNRSKNA
jgi:hypothetical protein